MGNEEWGMGKWEEKWSAFIWSGCNNDFSVTFACRALSRSVSSAWKLRVLCSFSFFVFESRKEHNGKGYCSSCNESDRSNAVDANGNFFLAPIPPLGHDATSFLVGATGIELLF